MSQQKKMNTSVIVITSDVDNDYSENKTCIFGLCPIFVTELFTVSEFLEVMSTIKWVF